MVAGRAADMPVQHLVSRRDHEDTALLEGVALCGRLTRAAAKCAQPRAPCLRAECRQHPRMGADRLVRDQVRVGEDGGVRSEALLEPGRGPRRAIADEDDPAVQRLYVGARRADLGDMLPAEDASEMTQPD